MASGQLANLLRCIHRLAGAPPTVTGTDRQLLERFATHRDEEAFAMLVWRHGARVLGVCWRILRQVQDAEDVFQATFLVLARKAGTVAWRDGVGNWLYEGAYRLAMDVKEQSTRRRARERQVRPMRASQTPAEEERQELANVLDEELHQLSERYRTPLLLCVVEGKTRDEAAQQLGCSLRTVKYRLERGRRLLRKRLVRRGVTLAFAGLMHDAGQVALSAALVHSTARAASLFAAGPLIHTGVALRAATLAEGMITGMLAVKVKTVTALVLTLAMVAAGTGLVAHRVVAVKQPDSSREAAPHPLAPNETVTAKHRRVDAYGDPLPAGALARLGTVRLRQGHFIFALAFSPDGKFIASGGADRLVPLWDADTDKQVRLFQDMRMT